MIPGSANPLLLGQTDAGGYEIERSLRFNYDDGSHLVRNFPLGNQRLFTFSAWLKLSVNEDTADNHYIFATDYNTSGSNPVIDRGFEFAYSKFSNKFELSDYGASTGPGDNSGTSAWGMGVTTAVFRDPSAWYHVVLSIDTTQSTAANRVKLYVNNQLHALSSYPAQNAYLSINQARNHYIGTHYLNGTFTRFFDGYMADVHFIDGQALAPTDFGETDNNGVWQPKEFTGTYGTPASTVLVGSPSYPSSFTSSGNKTSDQTGLSFGSWSGTYTGAETKIFKNSNTAAFSLQLSLAGPTTDRLLWYSDNATDWTYVGNISSLSNPYTLSGHKYYATSEGSGGATVTASSPATGVNSFRLPFTDNSTTQALGYDAAVTAPTLNPKGGMDVVTYSGTGSARSISDLAFQPDFVWIKVRNHTYYHYLWDSVRGATKELNSNTTSAEYTDTAGLTSFSSNGFGLGTGAGVNQSGKTYVAWAWKAGGAAVSNTDGTITSQVSASTDYGFSIVKYTGSSSGSSVGHSLNSAPKFIIGKRLDGSSEWSCYHESLGNNNAIILNTTAAAGSSSTWNSTTPTSSVVTLGAAYSVNYPSYEHVLYCWSEVAGFSKFSGYAGSGSSGNKITTGFKPRFLLIKGTDSTYEWQIFDSARNSSGNPRNLKLEPNTSDAEASTGNSVNFYDDGFDFNSNSDKLNGSSKNYIYAAFADRPGNNWTPNNLSAGISLNPTAKQNFDVVTYTGNGGTQSISSLAFQPDFVWLKKRSGAAWHFLFDSIRGTNKALFSNDANAESNYGSNYLDAFTSNGFTLGSNGDLNGNNSTFVAWCWKAGGAAVSNTNGSINSSVSVNANYGFSISTYTGNGTAGATIGHGLSSAPKLIITKCRSNNENWRVYTETTGNTKSLFISTNEVPNSSANYWNSTSPTSSVFSVGNDTGANGNGYTYVAYAWSEVAGFSKISSYAGSNSSQTIECGFKPAFVIIKCTTSGNDWIVQDNARGIEVLRPNLSDAELGGNYVSFTSTGFTLNTSDGRSNSSGDTYIYAAFAATIPGDPDNDSLVDSPSNGTQTDTGIGGEVVGNYATLNPLNGELTLSDGNLQSANSTGTWKANKSTIAVSSGKWYWEATPTVSSGTHYMQVGIILVNQATSGDPSDTAGAYIYNAANGKKYNNATSVSYGDTWGLNDVIGIAYDADNGSLSFYKNNVSQGVAYTGLSGTFAAVVGQYNTGTIVSNFGQRAFAYAAPSGYKALNTSSLSTPTIADGSKYFDAKLWTGNGGTQAITGLNFSPDFAWLKLRNGSSAISHILYDAVRGAGSLKGMNSDKTRAEGSCYDDTSNHGYLDSFDANGFTVVDGNAATNYTNSSNLSYVGWAWDAGSSNTTIAAGGLNSSVYNQSQTWSNDLSAAINSTENQAFDGNLTNVAAAATTAGAITWTPTGGMSYTSSVRAYTNSDYVNYAGETSGYSFNGGSTIETASAGWYTLATGSGTITSISHSYTASYRGGITAIEVDGKILVDSGVTPATNVPTIASTVRANPSAGFSIVSYSGVDAPSTNTVAHGLNVAPSVYIIKNRTSQSPVGWVFNTTVFDGSVDYMFLNLTNAKADQGSPWNTLPTSSVFTLGANDGNTCNAGDDFITYCFAPVEGYSAMGSYTGNGSADGPFVALSFKPRWIITKRTDSTDYWYIFDTARDVDNVVEAKLEANSNAAEYTSADWLDIVSNGFKIRASGGDINASGGTYLYMAFAENPFQANGGLAR